jgi:hypothetical protein
MHAGNNMLPFVTFRLCFPVFCSKWGSRNDLIMNKSPHLSGMRALGTRFRNLHAASWNRFLAAIASLFTVSLSLGNAAQSVTLAWDASPHPSIVGYKLHYGTTSGNPSQTKDVGKTTTATVSNLNDGTTYFFTVSACNGAGERQPSNQVSYTTSGAPSGTHVLTVNNGRGDGNYSAGTQVTVSANAPPPGQQFVAWTEDYQILGNPQSPTTTATMPSVGVTITATYVTAPTPTN